MRARGVVSRARRDVRHRRPTPTCAPRSVEHRGLDGTAAELGDARRHVRHLPTPLLGLGNLSNVLAATAVALQFDVPLDADCRDRGATAAGAPSRRAAAAPGRRHAHRRFVQLEPGGAEARARDGGRGDRQRPQDRGARRDARARRSRRRAAPRVGPTRGRGRSRPAHHGRRRAGARAGRRGDRGRHASERRSSTWRRATRRPTWRSPRVRPGDLVLVKGSRGIGTDLVVDAAEGGVRLMLYHLLPPLHAVALGAERDALHHVPHRGREPDGAGARAVPRPVDDPQAARVPDRSGHPAGRPGDAPHQGGHADDGRAADPDVGARADAPLGGPDAIRSSGLPCWRRRHSARSDSPTTT